jgi:glutathione S-transferase
MTEVVVHGVPGSPYVRTVLMTLEEKALPWRLQPVGLGGNRVAAYRAIHPFQKIPTLDHGDFRLYETAAILNYVDRLAAKPALRPEDLRLAARMDQVISIVNAYLAPRVSGAVTFPLLVAPKLGLPFDADAARAAIPQAREAVDEIGRILGNQDFIAGSTITLADLMLAPHLSFLPDFDEGTTILNDNTNVRAWTDRMKARPSFAATTWDVLAKRFPATAAA